MSHKPNGNFVNKFHLLLKFINNKVVVVVVHIIKLINFINRLLTGNEVISLWKRCDQKRIHKEIKNEESGKITKNSVYYNVKKFTHKINLLKKQGKNRRKSG